MNLFTYREKNALADVIQGSDRISEDGGILDYTDVRAVVGIDRETDTADILNGMLSVLGYHETLRALRAPTRNNEIGALYVELYEFVEAIYDDSYTTIDKTALASAVAIYKKLEAILSGEVDVELGEAGGLLDRISMIDRI